MPCSVRRGASQALTADGSDAERRRVARARLAARVCHGLVPLLVAAIMAHEAVPMRVGVGVRAGAPESHRRCAAALVAKQAVAAAALPHLVEVRVRVRVRAGVRVGLGVSVKANVWASTWVRASARVRVSRRAVVPRRGSCRPRRAPRAARAGAAAAPPPRAGSSRAAPRARWRGRTASRSTCGTRTQTSR